MPALHIGKRLPLGRALCQLVVFSGDPQQLLLSGVFAPEALGLRPLTHMNGISSAELGPSSELPLQILLLGERLVCLAA